MHIGGHKTRSLFDRHHVISDGDLKEAARRLEAAFTMPTITPLATLPLMSEGDYPLTH